MTLLCYPFTLLLIYSSRLLGKITAYFHLYFHHNFGLKFHLDVILKSLKLNLLLPVDTPMTAPSRQRPVGLLSFVLVVQGLCTSLLALVTSLVTLLLGPQLVHSSGTFGLLVYMDPALSLLAMIMLIATAAPQVGVFTA